MQFLHIDWRDRVNRIAPVGVAFSIAIDGLVILVLELLGRSKWRGLGPG